MSGSVCPEQVAQYSPEYPTGFFLLVALSKAGYGSGILPANSIVPLLWVMAAVFIMNGIGNFLSKNKIEQRIFGPVAFVLAAASVVLAL
jgi:hypothetical protein